MASVDRSIFRKRALDKYMQRQELHVILRLVSPRMFVFLWALLLLSIGAGALCLVYPGTSYRPGKRGSCTAEGSQWENWEGDRRLDYFTARSAGKSESRAAS